MKLTQSILFVGVLVLTACSSAGQSAATPATPTVPPQPTATQIKILPTPSSPGNSITWQTLQVTMEQVEITEQYLTDFGSSRVPSPGQKFLWVHVRLKNTGQAQMDAPLADHFSVLYAATELKPSYGHRAGHADYTVLDAFIFPNQEIDGWIRFDIPTAAELTDLRFVFLPESSRVGTSFSSPNYPYSNDKATFVWKCTQ